MQTPAIDRDKVLALFEKNRRRGRALFEMIPDEVYFARPISLRNPIVFYEGHLAAFNVNTLIKRAHGRKGIDERLELLFARGIDPEAEPDDASSAWPSRSQVVEYVERADELTRRSLEEDPLEGDTPYLRAGQAVFTILEHELMHAETLLYMYHRLDFASKRAPESDLLPRSSARPRSEWPNISCSAAGHSEREALRSTRIRIPAGRVTLGQERGRFGWDNEFSRHSVHVPAFEIDSLPVTNGEYLEFISDGGYEKSELWPEEGRSLIHHGATHPLFWERNGDDWTWRGMLEHSPLDLSAPAFVTQVEARAFAKWRGARLMTEAEFHRAAYATPQGRVRTYPWGEEPPDETRGNFDLRHWDPLPAGSFPAGASAWGVEELVGNGWEWTSTPFGPFDGFAPMASYPEYSADFFDGRHFVMKGASQATAAELLRPSFRNWFRPNYPYVYAKFRCVR